MSRFPLAQMDAVMRGFTYVVLAVLPLLAFLTPVTGPAGPIMAATVVFLLALFIGVWIGCRPTYFAVDTAGIHVAFPTWTRLIPTTGVTSVERYPGRSYRDEVGWGLRVGVGGLWGVFGWLYTPIGWVEVYSSRIDDLVLVRFEDRIPLLVSPADLDGFASAVEAAAPPRES